MRGQKFVFTVTNWNILNVPDFPALLYIFIIDQAIMQKIGNDQGMSARGQRHPLYWSAPITLS